MENVKRRYILINWPELKGLRKLTTEHLIWIWTNMKHKVKWMQGRALN